MLPDGWIPHRRGDGEVVGWLEIVGDDVVAHDLLGQQVTPRGLDWHEAEQALEDRGIGYLAEKHTLTTPYGKLVPVRIGEATTEQVTVVVDEFGMASVIGADLESHVLPFPVPRRLLRDYVRPRFDHRAWLDAEGRPITYGDRWDIGEDPPEELYSECAHPERFEPLVTTARALLDHLERRYDVERVQEESDGQTRVTLSPRSGTGRALTVTFPLPGLPGVEMPTPTSKAERWPMCGCDACDDSVPVLLDQLETAVFAVAEGTDGRREPWPLRG